MTWWKGGKNPPSTNTAAPDKHGTHVRVLGSKALAACIYSENKLYAGVHDFALSAF